MSQAPTTPEDRLELERLAALDGLEILDTGIEPLFDSLTELAALSFDTPIALISLVDRERQWFKSCIGLDVDHTDRDISFCRYAIQADATLVVLDALVDDRFADNPLVLGPPFIRFYAGAPLITPEGYRLGTLCVIDTKPRDTFCRAQANKLQALAASVMQALILRMAARERERIAAVAQERLELLGLAERMAGVGTWGLDVATNRTTWSEEVYRIHGLGAASESPELDGALACYHPEDAPVLAGYVQRAVAFGEDFEAHARVVRPGGEVRHVIARGACRREAGAIVGLFGTFQDVTVLKLADANLRASEARARHLMENATDMIIRLDSAGVALEVSPACRAFGYEPGDIIGANVADFVHPDDLEAVGAAMRDNFSGRASDRGLARECRMRTKDGAYRWIQGNPTIVRDDDGVVRASISIFRDVTERKEAEFARAESEARYRLFAENARDIIASYKPGGCFTYVSPAVSFVLGYAPEELVGKSPTQFMHPDDVKPTIAVLAAYVAGGPNAAPVRYEYRAFRKDGTVVWLEANPRAVFDPVSGALVEFQDVVRDATRRKAMEAELAAARDAAVAATAVKSDFLANMSHEIRTPLTAIIGFSSLLSARSDLPETAVQQVKRVSGASKALLVIVDDVLDFSKLEAGQMTISPRPVAIAELAQDALAMFAPQAEAKSLRLAFDAGPPAPALVLIDPDRLRQVLFNLLGNAIKFTDQGVVSLRMAYDRNSEVLGFEVADTGSGMNATQCAQLFQRFSQVDASATRRHGGTGLGLAICKALTEAMGGGISVTSQPESGSTFRVRIGAPMVAAIDPEAVSEPGILLSGVRVLIADDNAANRELARIHLVRQGAEVTTADGGAQAIAFAAQAPFDVILLDLRMPGLDGVAALARIRGQDGPNQDVPILAFTAGVADAASRELNGFDGVIAKPIAASDMILALVRATRWFGAEDQTGGGHAIRA
ncbi:PAS domain S-box protein [Phenylobacterium sp.]|uniref:PAS domain S-box protein n=1 Tax=Phenylobacterium sp. TaxID=1871053 RepID=UPI0025ECBCD5|nr:PAS domain S-box protein [Phenylobacterium sp.]